MTTTKTFFENILLDASLVVALLAALLYGLGLMFIEGSMDGYGVSSNLVDAGFRYTVLLGLLSVFITPFYGSEVWVFSLLGVVPFIIRRYHPGMPVQVVYAGFVFLLVFQLAASQDAGESFSADEMKVISLAYTDPSAGKPGFDFVKLMYTNENGKPGSLSGYHLNLPGDYFVIVQQEATVAIARSKVSSAIYRHQ